MALLWVDGFEAYGSGSTARTTLPYKYTNSVVTTNTTTDTGRISGAAIKMAGATIEYITTPNLGNVGTIIIGFAFKADQLVNRRICALREADAATEGFNVRLTTGGALAAYRQDSIYATSAGSLISTGVWNYIEIKVTVGNSGSYEIRINGANVLSDGSEDTQAGSNAYCNRARLFGPSSGEGFFWFDDWYVLDSTGGANDDFLGDKRVITLYPDSAGSDTDFTPNTGSNYTTVDENGADGDTSYVESSTSGHTDLYNFDASTLGTIIGVQVNAVCKKSDVTDFDIHLPVLSDSTQSDGSATTVDHTDYKNVYRILEEDPNTTAPWTNSDLSAAEFGIKVG